MQNRKSYRPLTIALLVGLIPALYAAEPEAGKAFSSLTRDEAIGVLTQSPWARQETYTRIVGGIGSGISGEKEIYSTFFVRFLSARPVREAYARLKQIEANYDQLSRGDRRKFDDSLAPGLNLDVTRWIIITLGFRSNDPSLELRVRQFLEVQTTETMKARAYLSTDRFPQLKLAAYFPPKEVEVGAKFVFPRSVEDIPVVTPNDTRVTFEADIPGFQSDLRASFPVTEMRVSGEPIL